MESPKPITTAITRKPGLNFAQGITSSNLGIPSYELMVQQHDAYIQVLKTSGATVIELDALPEFPDAYFVEDVAVITPQLAVITNPGAEARKGETDAIEAILARFRQTAPIKPPGTLDGGDVLIAGEYVFIGVSARTNREGARQLGSILEESGYSCIPIPVSAGLHLKSSVNYLGKNTLLITGDFAGRREFGDFEKIIVDQDETYAANTLRINDILITPAGFPKTRKKLDAIGYAIIELDVSEARKMDGGLTCMSLRL